MSRKLFLVIIILVLFTLITQTYSVKIGSSLALKMKHHHHENPMNIIIRTVNGTEDVLNKLNQINYPNRGTRLTTVTNTLKNYSIECQKYIVPILESYKNIKYKSYWITNEIYVMNATKSLIEKLSTLNSIYEINEEIIIKLEKPISIKLIRINNPMMTIQPNIKKIQADLVWNNLNINGSGIIVGGIDSGVRVTHEALKNNFIGTATNNNYGWYDPSFKSLIPNDPVGHGTHTMGLIVGSHGIGVAPGAKWMACRGCKSDECTQSDLIECAEFMSCPTKLDGTEPNCHKAPHLISNSWGGGQGEIFYDSFISAWKTSGIIPIFASGNNGPNCSSVNSPGDSQIDVITVGATNINDELAFFSSIGPTVFGTIKPDITAPGVNILSAYFTGDNDYAILDGTSMATPHVSGVVALLKSYINHLSFNNIQKYLYTNTEQKGLISTTTNADQNCGRIDEKIFPNNAFGFGRVNAYQSVKHLMTSN